MTPIRLNLPDCSRVAVSAPGGVRPGRVLCHTTEPHHAAEVVKFMAFIALYFGETR